MAEVVVSDAYVQNRANTGSLARDLIYRQPPSVEGSELVLPFRDPQEQRLPLPAGAGGLAGVRVIRNASDELRGTLQSTADGSTYTSLIDVALPEPNPRLLRRFAFYPVESEDPVREFTAADFTGQYGSTSESRDVAWAAPPDPAPAGYVFGFSIPTETVSGDYYAAAGDLPTGTPLGGIRKIGFGVDQRQLFGVAILDETIQLTINGREYRVYRTRGKQRGGFFSQMMRVSLAWSNIPA